MLNLTITLSRSAQASHELGLLSPPMPGRAPGRDVLRLPGMRVDDPAIHAEMRIEDTADDALFAAGFYLYGWNVEWTHDVGGIPIYSSSTMVDQLAAPASRDRRPGKVVMLMHDVMMRTASAASELTRIIQGVRDRGSRLARLSEYYMIAEPQRPFFS